MGLDELLAAIDGDIGDFRIEVSPSNTVAAFGNSSGQQEAMELVTPKRRRKKKQMDSNRARNARRFEVVKLRREAEDLELMLQQLKTIRSQRDYMKDKSAQTTEEDASAIPEVWQDICARQLARRLKAEKENIRLKKQWKEEKQVVKGIEKMLFKKMMQRDIPQQGGSKHTRRTDLPEEYIKRVAAFVFDGLSSGVDASYRDVETIIASNGHAPTNVVTHQPLLRGGVKGMYRRLFDKRVVPFTLQETGDAWWRLWHNYRRRRMPDTTTNVITESFGLEMTDFKTNASGTSYGQQILRRYVEENRIVFVWNSYIEPFVFENEPVSGVYMLEQSHVLIRPEDPETTADDDEKDECSTSISTCYVITPHFLDPKLKNDPKTTTLIDFLVSALSANIAARNETVENLLLDEALRKHNFSL